MSTGKYVVRTPYTKEQAQTFSGAMRMFMERAQGMGIFLVWQKGKGSVKDPGPRYHFWEIDNEQDAHAFYLACGDKITQWGVRNECN